MEELKEKFDDIFGERSDSLFAGIVWRFIEQNFVPKEEYRKMLEAQENNYFKTVLKHGEQLSHSRKEGLKRAVEICDIQIQLYDQRIKDDNSEKLNEK